MSALNRIRLVVLILVFVGACLGICIWGYGTWRGFFAEPARFAFAVVIIVLSIASAFTDSSGLSAGVREDKANRWILLPMTAISFLMAWLPPHLDRLGTYVLGGGTIRWIGVGATLIGGVLRLAPVFALGNRFSGLVAIQHEHLLKTDGIYSVVRHPSYLGLLVGALGWCLVFRGVIPGLLITALVAMLVVARMNSEENLLSDQFGEQYIAYRSRTWRLLPWVY